MNPDREMIDRAARGDAAALEELAASHRPIARRTALAVTGDADAAEDIAQDAMIRLQASLPGFRGDSDLATWLHRVVLNLSYDYLRRVRRRRAEVPIGAARATGDPDSADPHRAIDAERATEALRQALERLPGEQREVLVLRYLSGLSYAEIAKVTRTREGTVASRIFRALERLGSEVEPKHLEIVR